MASTAGSGRRPAPDEPDALVLGMGPGGEEVAGRLAEAGWSVVGVDANLLGGECPYWGCVPSKMMVRAADLLGEARRIPGIAGEVELRPEWAPVAARVRGATSGWDDTEAVERFESKGGSFVRGWGRIEGPRRVVVGDRTFSPRRALVVATGSAPATPPLPGLDTTPYWTNREAIECDELPQSLLVLGGGAVGVELGQVFGRFGVEVMVVEAAPRLLAAEEPESSSLVYDVLTADGVSVHVGTSVDGVVHDASGFTLRTGAGASLRADRLLVATGRRVNLAAIGAGTLGVDEGGRAILVDNRLRVASGVWAVGDVTGKGAFTHVAMYQARIAAGDILAGPAGGTETASYDAVPRVTFTDPEIGAVGMTEEQARASGLEVRVASTSVPESARGWIHGPGNAGFIKLVADAGRRVLVGATAASPAGGEVLGLLSLAVHASVPVDRLATLIYAYPTFHRAIETVVDRLCTELPELAAVDTWP